MVRPRTERPPFHGNGFFIAAVLAPGMATAIFYLGVALAGSSHGPVGGVGGLIGSLLLLLLIVTVWGALPSFVFGGLVLTGLGVAALSPTAAMVFAPWVMTGLNRPGVSGEDWWLTASLLLAGVAAGLIYSAFAKRG